MPPAVIPLVGDVVRNSQDTAPCPFTTRTREDQQHRNHQEDRHEQEQHLEEPFHLLVPPIQGRRLEHSLRPLPHAANHEVGGEVDDEGDHEEEDPQREEGPVVVGSYRGFSQLGRDGRREGPDRIE